MQVERNEAAAGGGDACAAMSQGEQAVLQRPSLECLAGGEQPAQGEQRRVEPRLFRAEIARFGHQPLSCRCASRNHRYLSSAREIPVNRSAVSASPSLAVSSMADRTALPNAATCVDR